MCSRLQDIGESLRAAGVEGKPVSLNEAEVLPGVKTGSVDGILFGEVFEHLLNCPYGVLKEFKRVLKVGGVMVLTTPNPSTLMNLWRLAVDRPLMRGGKEFATMPKYESGQWITYAEIHYREYTADEMRRMFEDLGFEIVGFSYMPMGLGKNQPLSRRIIKRLPLWSLFNRTRMLAPTQCWAVVKR